MIKIQTKIDVAKNSARNAPKENGGASGRFLPKPLLLRLRLPNSKKISRVFCEILSPKNSFRKTESALFRHLPRILGRQNTKEKCPFLFQKKSAPAKSEMQGVFFLSGFPPRLCEAVAGRFTYRRDCFQNTFELCTIKTVRAPRE